MAPPPSSLSLHLTEYLGGDERLLGNGVAEADDFGRVAKMIRDTALVISEPNSEGLVGTLTREDLCAIASAVGRMPVRQPVRAPVWAPPVALAAVAVVMAAVMVNGPQDMITPEGLPSSSTIAQTSPSPADAEGIVSPVRTTRTSAVRTPSDELTDESSDAEGGSAKGRRQ